MVWSLGPKAFKYESLEPKGVLLGFMKWDLAFLFSLWMPLLWLMVLGVQLVWEIQWTVFLSRSFPESTYSEQVFPQGAEGFVEARLKHGWCFRVLAGGPAYIMHTCLKGPRFSEAPVLL